MPFIAARLSPTIQRRPVALVVVSALLLASCSSLPLTGSRGPVSKLSVSQRDAASIISDYRTAHGLSAVAIDSGLQEVAQRQADAMGTADELSHEVDGTLPRRLARNGLDPSAAIENVSGGYSNLASVIEGWKRSPQHNKNLLFAPMRRMGIAEASAPKTRFKTWWSLVMTN